MRLSEYIEENIEKLYQKENTRRIEVYPEVFKDLSEEQHDEQRTKF